MPPTAPASALRAGSTLAQRELWRTVGSGRVFGKDSFRNRRIPIQGERQGELYTDLHHARKRPIHW